MLESDWGGFQGARPRDTHLRVRVHVVLVVVVFSDARCDWRVVAHLFSKVFVVGADQFIRFT